MNTHSFTKATIALTIGLIGLSSCSLAAAPLTRFVTAAADVQAETTSFDEANSLDTVQFASAIALRKEAGENDILTDADKIQAILEARTAIMDKQQMINTVKMDITINFNDVKALRDAFVEQELELTTEERAWLLELRSELRGMRDQVKVTIGKVYAAIGELRGQYQLANLDLIYSVYLTANIHMETRLDLINRLDAIIIEVKDFLTIKVG